MAIDPVTAMLIVQGFNVGLGMLLGRQGGKQKEAASRIVDDAEVEFKRLVSQWENTEPKTLQAQRIYLEAVVKGFDDVKRFLLDPQLGEHGQRGVMERFGTYDPITNTGIRGSRWDWWSYYYDPIANAVIRDENGVVLDNSLVWRNVNQANVSGSGTMGLNSSLFLFAGLGLVAFGLFKGK